MANPRLPSQIEDINVELRHRPTVENNGDKSTVFSESSEDKEGTEILYPRVKHKRLLSSDEAWKEYKRTGKHLGKFRGPNRVRDAEKMGQLIHKQQETAPGISNLLGSYKF